MLMMIHISDRRLAWLLAFHLVGRSGAAIARALARESAAMTVTTAPGSGRQLRLAQPADRWQGWLRRLGIGAACFFLPAFWQLLMAGFSSRPSRC